MCGYHKGGNDYGCCDACSPDLFFDERFDICDRIWENPPYGIRVRFAFLVAQVEICRSPDFIIYMSNNPSNLPSSTEANRAIQR